MKYYLLFNTVSLCRYNYPKSSKDKSGEGKKDHPNLIICTDQLALQNVIRGGESRNEQYMMTLEIESE